MYGSFEVYYCSSDRNEMFYFCYCTTIHASRTNQVASMLERQVISSHINISVEEKKNVTTLVMTKQFTIRLRVTIRWTPRGRQLSPCSHERLRDCGRVTIMSEERWVSVVFWTIDVLWCDGWKRPTERDRCLQKFDKTNLPVKQFPWAAMLSHNRVRVMS